MRFFWLCFWVLVLVAGLFRARQQFLELHEKYRVRLATMEAPGDSSAPQEPESLENWVMPVIQYWDFQAFEERVHPEIRSRIPEGNLKALFEAVAISLGPLKDFQEFSLQEPEPKLWEGEKQAEARIRFFAGEARVQIRFVESGAMRWMTDFAVESPRVGAVLQAAQEAQEQDRWNPEIFHRKLTA